jgi:hypothetical protein
MKIKDNDENNELFPSEFTGILEYCDGAEEPCSTWVRYYKNGKEHRENGPAIECSDGDKLWFLNGKLHRENGPAIEFANGIKNWYLNGRYFYLEKEHKIEIKKFKKFSRITSREL